MNYLLKKMIREILVEAKAAKVPKALPYTKIGADQAVKSRLSQGFGGKKFVSKTVDGALRFKPDDWQMPRKWELNDPEFPSLSKENGDEKFDDFFISVFDDHDIAGRTFKFEKIIPPGRPAGKSSIYKTYHFKDSEEFDYYFLITRGMNEGELFEDDVKQDVINYLANREKPLTDKLAKLLDKLNINDRDISSIDEKPKKVSNRIFSDVGPSNIGAQITDLTLKLTSGGSVFISIKYFNGKTVANLSYHGFEKDSELMKFSEDEKDAFFNLFKTENGEDVKGTILNFYNEKRSADAITSSLKIANTEKVKAYLQSVIGYGYWFAKWEGNDWNVTDLTCAPGSKDECEKKNSRFVGDIQMANLKLSGKTSSISIKTSTRTFKVIIRNKSGGNVPNRMSIDIDSIVEQ